jgi:hypothetical protein
MKKFLALSLAAALALTTMSVGVSAMSTTGRALVVMLALSGVAAIPIGIGQALFMGTWKACRKRRALLVVLSLMAGTAVGTIFLGLTPVVTTGGVLYTAATTALFRVLPAGVVLLLLIKLYAAVQTARFWFERFVGRRRLPAAWH